MAAPSVLGHGRFWGRRSDPDWSGRFSHRPGPRTSPVGTNTGRPYLSIFGEIDIERTCYGHDRVEAVPLDAQLHLPQRQYSYLLQRWLGVFVVDDAHAEAVRKLETILGLEIAVRHRRISTGSRPATWSRSRDSLPVPERDRRGTDLGGDGRLQRGSPGAFSLAPRGGDRGPASGLGEPAPRQG